MVPAPNTKAQTPQAAGSSSTLEDINPRYQEIENLINRIGKHQYYKRLKRARRIIHRRLTNKGLNAVQAENLTGNLITNIYNVWESSSQATGNRLIDLEKLEADIPDIKTSTPRQIANRIIL